MSPAYTNLRTARPKCDYLRPVVDGNGVLTKFVVVIEFDVEETDTWTVIARRREEVDVLATATVAQKSSLQTVYNALVKAAVNK